MPKFELDHVAVALHSMEPALKLFRDALGGRHVSGGREGGDWSWFQLEYPGGGRVELLEPRTDQPSFLSRYLEKRGEGLHHVTFKTDDIKEAIPLIQSHGYELVDINLRSPFWKEAFLRPSKAHGVLVQIAQEG
ncbi:MAG: VOC family protein [Acidimicrobiia bacterium]